MGVGYCAQIICGGANLAMKNPPNRVQPSLIRRPITHLWPIYLGKMQLFSQKLIDRNIMHWEKFPFAHQGDVYAEKSVEHIKIGKIDKFLKNKWNLTYLLWHVEQIQGHQMWCPRTRSWKYKCPQTMELAKDSSPDMCRNLCRLSHGDEKLSEIVPEMFCVDLKAPNII